MNETAHEQLSALMDGELTRDEARFLLRRVDRDAGLASRWSRYHVARAVLQRQFVPGATADDRFAAAVMSRLEHDRAVVPRGAARFARWAGGGAIAAAVAVVALIATRPAGDTGSLPAVSADAVAVAAPALPAPSLLLPQAPVNQVRPQPAFVPMPAMPVSFSDAQPASFESFVPRYAMPRTPAQNLDASPNGFVPYVLMVGSRQKPEAQATADQDAAAK